MKLYFSIVLQGSALERFDKKGILPMMRGMSTERIESDSMGNVSLPRRAYYGAQTQRAKTNFPISGLVPHPAYILATVMIKRTAAVVHKKLGLFSDSRAESIITASDEILVGSMQDQFVVDPYQAGAGTSHNMNVNEVIANRANEILGAPLGSYQFVHPNDHVNMSQSTNDVIPTAIRLAALSMMPELQKTLERLEKTLVKKSGQFRSVVKAGRTHLQDALPVRLGDEFSGYGQAIHDDRQRLKTASASLLRIGIGGSAVGTGANTHPRYRGMMIQELKRLTKQPLISSPNLFDTMQNTSDFLAVSSSFRILAQNLIRIGSDLRLLSSGPRAGFAEIRLPVVQPGSSIMPGKVNPSIIEMLTMVSFQIIGYDTAILMASQAGQLELNVMLPLIAFNLLEQIRLLTNAISVFTDKCLIGIEADEEMCRFWLERSSGAAAILNPYIGYEKTAALVKESVKKNIPLRDLVIEKKILTKKEAEKIFSPDYLTKPNILPQSLPLNKFGKSRSS